MNKHLLVQILRVFSCLLLIGSSLSSVFGFQSAIPNIEGKWNLTELGRTLTDNSIWRLDNPTKIDSGSEVKEIEQTRSYVRVTTSYADGNQSEMVYSILSVNKTTNMLKLKSIKSDQNWQWSEVYVVDNGNTIFWCDRHMPAALGGIFGDGWLKEVYVRSGSGGVSVSTASQGEGGWFSSVLGWIWTLIKYLFYIVVVIFGGIMILGCISVLLKEDSETGDSSISTVDKESSKISLVANTLTSDPRAESSKAPLDRNSKLHYECPHCEYIMKFPTDLITKVIGKNGKCTSCGKAVLIREEDLRLPFDTDRTQ